MIKSLKLTYLEERRTYNRLVMLYKIAGVWCRQRILIIKPEGRIVKSANYNDHIVSNIPEVE
jgi:hypothetical protein